MHTKLKRRSDIGVLIVVTWSRIIPEEQANICNYTLCSNERLYNRASCVGY